MNHLNVDHDDFPIFDEYDKTFRSFLADFNELSSVAELSDNQKLTLLPTRLRRRPKWYFRGLSNERKNTYDKAIESLTTEFDNESLLRKDLYSIKQGQSTLDEYVEKMEQMFTELNFKPDEKLDFFMAGLDENTQNDLFLNEIDSYEKAVRRLKLKLSIEKRKSSKSKKPFTRDREMSENKAHQSKTMGNDQLCYVCQEPGHLAINCWFRERFFKKNTTSNAKI